MRVLLIPAAGRGSRLGGSAPKILHPVAGRPMLGWLVERYEHLVDAFIFVARPGDASQIGDHARQVTDKPIRVAVQPAPTGMLDAILDARAHIRDLDPAWVWITWCDQIAISQQTVEQLARLCDAEDCALLLPTAKKPDPYVHLQRDEEGRIIRVLHSRDGDEMPSQGEQDAGLFALRAATYLEDLPRFAADRVASATTGERNFLPFIPHVAARGNVATFNVDPIESVGVNDPNDLHQVEGYLRDRR